MHVFDGFLDMDALVLSCRFGCRCSLAAVEKILRLLCAFVHRYGDGTRVVRYIRSKARRLGMDCFFEVEAAIRSTTTLRHTTNKQATLEKRAPLPPKGKSRPTHHLKTPTSHQEICHKPKIMTRSKTTKTISSNTRRTSQSIKLTTNRMALTECISSDVENNALPPQTKITPAQMTLHMMGAKPFEDSQASPALTKKQQKLANQDSSIHNIRSQKTPSPIPTPNFSSITIVPTEK